MELNDIFTQPEVLRAIATIAASVSGIAVLYVISLWSLAKGATYWRVVRGAVPTIRAAVDEPTDAANLAIDRVLDRFYKAQWENMAAVFLPKMLDEFNKIMETNLAKPPQEVNISAPEQSPREVTDAIAQIVRETG